MVSLVASIERAVECCGSVHGASHCCRDAQKGPDKKKQPKFPAQPLVTSVSKQADSDEDEEAYEQAPRQKAAETVKERTRADLLPVKVDGELVYRRDARPDDRALPQVGLDASDVFKAYHILEGALACSPRSPGSHSGARSA